MNSVDIITLVNSNPIEKFSKNYNSKIIEKIREKFSEKDKQLFVANFYCYLKYNTKTDFVIRLDDIWDWIGYTRIDIVKNILVNNFIENVDYKIEKVNIDKIVNGGKNKENIKMTINCFKQLCLSAKTKQSKEIHKYYLALEEIIFDLLCEQSEEFAMEVADVKQKLQIKEEILEETKQTLKETEVKLEVKKEQLDKNIIDNFGKTELVYIGYAEEGILLKAGFSYNLKDRLYDHKREIRPDFNVVHVVSTIYYIELERRMKNDPLLMKYRTSKVYNGKLQTELYKVDEKFTIKEFHERVLYLKAEIEKEDLLIKENHDLKSELLNLKKEIEELKNKKMEKMYGIKYDLELNSMNNLIDLNLKIKKAMCLNFLVNFIANKIIENKKNIDFEIRITLDELFDKYKEYRISNRCGEPLNYEKYEKMFITKTFNEIDGIVNSLTHGGISLKTLYVDKIVFWLVKNIKIPHNFTNLFREITQKTELPKHCVILKINNEENDDMSLKLAYSFLIHILIKYKNDDEEIIIRQSVLTPEYVKFMTTENKLYKLTVSTLYNKIFEKIPGIIYNHNFNNIRVLKFNVKKIVKWIIENLEIPLEFRTILESL